MKERLQKVLAQAGVASRRHAEELIREGRVQVNGATVIVMGVQVDPAEDEIAVDGKPIRPGRPPVYFLVNKPRGVLSTARDDRGRPTVVGLVHTSERVFPVGRLDLDSEGLVLVTNDGALMQRLTHPSYELEKEYRVLVQGSISEAALIELVKGVPLEDGVAKADEAAIIAPAGRDTWIRVVLHEGKKREIRRMLATLGYNVKELVRVRMGPLELGVLPVGQARPLTARELEALSAKS